MSITTASVCNLLIVRWDVGSCSSALWYTILGQFPSHLTNTILIQEIACNQNIGPDIRGSHRGDSHTPLPQLQRSSWACYGFPPWWSVTLHKHKSPSSLVGLLCFSWITPVQADAKSTWRLSERAPYLSRRVRVGYVCVPSGCVHVCGYVWRVCVCLCTALSTVAGLRVCVCFHLENDVTSIHNQSHHLQELLVFHMKSPETNDFLALHRKIKYNHFHFIFFSPMW